MFYCLYSEDGKYVGTWDPVCKEICYDGPKDRRVKKVFEECEMEEEGTWNLLLRSKGKNLNGIMTLDGNIIYTKQRVPYCRCVSDSESRTYILSELIDETKVNGLGDLFQEISL